MKLGIVLRTTGPTPRLDLDFVLEAERLGFDSAWTSEAWGGDTVTTVSWLLARTTKIKGGTGIMQMQARTPACAAMTAMSLQALSGGRFLLGIGPSGPQVIEGWHGVAYGKPLARTKEYVSIIRQIFAREKPLEHKGEHYQIPYTGPGATGLGKLLKTIIHPSPNLKIYAASIAPAGLRTAAEVADGVLPFLMSPEQADAIVAPVREGLAAAAAPKTLADFDIAPYVRVRMGDDVAACRDELRPVSVPSPLAGEGGEASEAEPDAQRNTRYALPWPPFPDAPPASWRRPLTPRYLIRFGSRRSPVAAARPTPSARGVFLHLRHPMAPAYRTALFSKLHEA